jgi:hypothetical protein
VIRRLFRAALFLGALGAIVYLIARLLDEEPATPAGGARPDGPWPPLEPLDTAPPWVEPTDGACPASHPVKGKLRSRIYHLPGMLAYERTKADRCYADAAQAEADGFRAAKR